MREFRDDALGRVVWVPCRAHDLHGSGVRVRRPSGQACVWSQDGSGRSERPVMEVTHLRFWSSIQTMWRTESNPSRYPIRSLKSMDAASTRCSRSGSLGLPFRTHWRPQPSILIGPSNRSQQSLPWCTIQEGHYYRGGNAKAGTAGATTNLFHEDRSSGSASQYGGRRIRRKSRGAEACRELVALDMR